MMYGHQRCEKDIEPVPDPRGKGPDKCPECHAYLPTIKKREKTKRSMGPGKDGLFHFNVGAHTSLNSDEMQLMENLVNMGVGDNPQDILKKGVYALATSFKLGGGNMLNANEKKEDIDPEKVIDGMQAREARDVYLENLRKKAKTGDNLDSKGMLDIVKNRQYAKMLEDMDKEKGEGGFDKLIQLQMLQSLAPQDNSNNGSNNANEALLKQVQDLQVQLREQRQESKMQEMINRFESKLGQGNSGSDEAKTLKDFMVEMEKIKEQGRTAMEQSKTDTQIEVEKRKQLELDHKLEDMQRRTQEIVDRSQGKQGITKDDIAEIKGTIQMAKELSNEFGGEEKKGKDAGELVTDIISKTLENLTPIAKDYMQNKANQPQPQPQVDPVYTQPPLTNPGPVNQEFVSPESMNTEPVNPEPPQPAPVSSEEDMAKMMHQQQKPPDGKAQ